MAEFLRLESLEKRFGTVPVTRSVSLSASQGEIVALLGPSGSGKTTILRLVAGFETPDGGRVFVDGEDVTAVSPERRRFGMVFQHYALFPHMTAGENVAFGLQTQKAPRDEVRKRVAEMLELAGLSGFEDRRVTALSGGQQQRVALARALAPNPRVLLLDEPLSNLDPSLREKTRRELKRAIRRVGITTLFVTHEQEEAFALGDRVAVLNEGRLEQVGSPEELFEKPASRFVATFIGRSSIITAIWERGRAARIPRGPPLAGPRGSGRRFGNEGRSGHSPGGGELCGTRGRGVPGGRGLRAPLRGARLLLPHRDALGRGNRGARAPGRRARRRSRPDRALTHRPAAPRFSEADMSRHLRRLAPVLLMLVLFWIVGYPLLLTLAEALDAPHWTLAHVSEFARRPAEWQALWASLWIALATVALSAAIGIPLAFVFERAEFPGRRLLGTLVALPVALPPLIGVLAFLFLYGESGLMSRPIQALLGLKEPPWRLTGPGGDPARARVLDVRVFLSLHAGGPLPPRRRLPGGRGEPGRRPAAHALAGHSPPAPARADRRGPPDLHDLARILQRPLRLRGQLPGDDDADRRVEVERRLPARDGRDGHARGAGPGRSLAPAPRRARARHRRHGPGCRTAAAVPGRRKMARGRRRLGADDSAPAAARHADPDLAGASKHLDDRGVSAAIGPDQLRGALRAARTDPSGRQLAVDGVGGDGGRAPARIRRGVPRGPQAGPFRRGNGDAHRSCRGRCRGPSSRWRWRRLSA